jgi:Fic family protein
MGFSLDFDITERPWWTPSYVDPRSVLTRVEEHRKLKTIIDAQRADPDNVLIFEGFVQFHKLRYLMEILVGENIIPEGTTIETIEELLGTPREDRTAKKIENLRDTVEMLFPDIFAVEFNIEQFTPEFIQRIHGEVGKDLIQDAGQFRTRWAAPSQEEWVYLDPIRVPESLNLLCRDVRRALENETGLVNRVKMAASFMTNFLHIHPFSNGNGRVARLCVSFLLSETSVVPVPLYAGTRSREDLLTALRISRETVPFKPSALARFILDSMVKLNVNVCAILDLMP